MPPVSPTTPRPAPSTPSTVTPPPYTPRALTPAEKRYLNEKDKRGLELLERYVSTRGPVQPGTDGAVGRHVKRMLGVGGYARMLDLKSDEIGGGTVAALKQFQSASGLPATGAVDMATLRRLERLELHMRMNGDKFVGVGQHGKSVLDAEKRLARLGYDVGAKDGTWDKQDQAAIAKFRDDQGGGLAKGKDLLTRVAGRALEVESGRLNHGVYRGRVKKTGERTRLNALTAKEAEKGLAEGAKGRAVRNVQAHLKSAGFDPKHYDGNFDERTAGMVRAFQRKAGLPDTGAVDAKTWKALQRTQLLATDAFSPSQARDERSGAVKATQKELRDLGFKKVRVNGLFDGATERAVKAFEKQQKLKVDGKVSRPEYEKMKRVEKAREMNLNTVQGCAKFLLQSKNVSFWTGLSTGSDRKNVERLARGQKAYVPAKGWYVTPKLSVMKALVAMAKKGPIMINALTGGTHSPNSNHYRGTAVDLDISTGNSGMIESVARQYGGYRNFERDHIHLDF